MTPDESLSEAVLSEVATAEGIDPVALDTPFHDVVDVDALDSLFQDGTGEVTFEYAGYEVTVDDDANVDLDAGFD